VETWKELGNIMLSEINQAHGDKYHMFSFICGMKIIKFKETGRMVVIRG
jgi:hypothetical protein